MRSEESENISGFRRVAIKRVQPVGAHEEEVYPNFKIMIKYFLCL